VQQWRHMQDFFQRLSRLLFSFHGGLHLMRRPGQVRGEADADTAYRTSLMEGVRDLAVIEALLASSAQGGSAVPVHQGELE